MQKFKMSKVNSLKGQRSKYVVFYTTNGSITIFKAAASCVIAECPGDEQKHDSVVENEGEDERKLRERIPEAKANVALCWSKYCLNLLKLSAETEDDETKGS